MTSTTKVVALERAEVRVGGRELWQGLDLELEPGELLAIVGPNGAGKSTLLRVMLGLTPLCAGSARVLGVTPDAARSRVGFLPQRRSFDASVPVRGVDLVRLGLDGHRWGLSLPISRQARERRRTSRAQVDAALAHVGASHVGHRRIGEVSGGEQQRLLLAQALVRRPELLLLDEPFDGLDLPAKTDLMALLIHLCRDHGLTIALVTHDLHQLSADVDRVLVIGASGAAAGIPAEMLTASVLDAAYGRVVGNCSPIPSW